MIYELIVKEVYERTFEIEAASEKEARAIFERTTIADLNETEEQLTARKIFCVRAK